MVAALVSTLGACTRDLDSTGTCSLLCPEQEIEVQQAILEPVILDTTLALFPIRGEEQALLVAAEGATLDSRAFYRFDATPTRYLPLGQDSVPITVLHDAFLRVRVDTMNARVPEGSVLEVYDVDGDTPDEDVDVLLTRFTPDRLLGSLVLVPPLIDDTVRVPLDRERVLDVLLANERLRVGVRATSPDGRVLLPLAPLEAAIGIDPTPDANIGVIITGPESRTPVEDPNLRRSLTSYMLVAAGSSALPEDVISAGGLPGRRTLMRFEIPPSILDSSSIVRATLVLSQVPVPGAPVGDSALLMPVPVQASDAVTDILQSILLSGNPGSGGVDSRVIDTLRLAAVGEGDREIELQGLLAVWRSSTTGRPQRAIVLQIAREGLTPVELRFHSREAPEGLRPRLRLTYIPRVNLGLP